ncbi:MAG: hypothetical protein ABI882_20470 [Acidobacteriota bacterium]
MITTARKLVVIILMSAVLAIPGQAYAESGQRKPPETIREKPKGDDKDKGRDQDRRSKGGEDSKKKDNKKKPD